MRKDNFIAPVILNKPNTLRHPVYRIHDHRSSAKEEYDDVIDKADQKEQSAQDHADKGQWLSAKSSGVILNIFETEKSGYESDQPGQR